MCKTVQYMIVVTCLGSVYTLVLMSLDRFLAVVHPISSMSIRTERNALMYVKRNKNVANNKVENFSHFFPFSLFAEPHYSLGSSSLQLQFQLLFAMAKLRTCTKATTIRHVCSYQSKDTIIACFK